MAYWVYENWRSGPHRNRLHTAECVFCADGRGYLGGADGANGQWHGPFDTYEEADAASSELRGPTYCCVSCRPDLS
jgi:F-type H+-transporting ATPase subunit beta